MKQCLASFTQASLFDKIYLIVRIAFGLYFAIMFGFGKLFAGPEMWAQIGGAVGLIGIPSGFVVFGFLAAFAESIGALAIAAGFLTRVAAAGIFVTMVMASVFHIATDMGSPLLAIILGCIALAIVVIGGRNLSVDAKLCKFCPFSKNKEKHHA